MLDDKARVDVVSRNEFTHLHLAARENCVEAVRYLAEKGVQFNLQDSDGATALYIAAYSSSDEIVKILLPISQQIQTFQTMVRPI